MLASGQEPKKSELPSEELQIQYKSNFDRQGGAVNTVNTCSASRCSGECVAGLLWGYGGE